jgi:hypothetical protein
MPYPGPLASGFALARPQQDASGRADEPGRSAAERVLPLGPASLRAAFQDLYGRPPFRAERERWLGGGLPKLVHELVGTQEFWSAWLRAQLYYFLLVRNFRPASEGVTSLPSELAEGRLGALEALHRIALSPAFDARNPGADTFVTVVMEQFLGIEVQKETRELEIGKRVYDGHPGTFLGRAGSTQADVVRIALEDERCARRFLEREYRRCVRAEPDKRELARWTRELREGTTDYPTLVREWLLSDAWTQRLAQREPMENRLFVRGLWVDLFDRLPDEEELETLANALDGLGDPGPLRSVLARVLTDGDGLSLPKKEEIRDPTAWVAGSFERLLGRAPEHDELAAFVDAFEEPECAPATVIRALVTHPEYHRY